MICAPLSAASDRADTSRKEAEAVRLGSIWERGSVTDAISLYREAADQWSQVGENRRAVHCLNEAAKLTQTSEYDLTKQLLNDALGLSASDDLRPERITTLSLLSLRSLERGDQLVALKSVGEAQTLSLQTDHPTARSYAHLARGMYEYYFGTIAEALEQFDQAEPLAQQAEDIWLRTQVFLYSGFARLRNAQPVEAEQKIDRARSHSESNGYHKGQALAYAGLGYIHFSTSERQKALDLFQKAERLMPDDFEWIERGRVRSLIGEIYLDHGYLELAEVSLLQAVAHYERAGYKFGKAGSLKYLAEVYLAGNETEEARITFEKARRLAQELDDRFLIADINEGIGNVESRLGNYDKAIRSYLDALATYESVGVRMAGVRSLLGDAHERSGEVSLARRYYSDAIEISEQTRDLIVQSETLHRLALLERREMNFTEASKAIRRSVDLTERFYSDIANFRMKRSYLTSAYDRFEVLTELLMLDYSHSNSAAAGHEAFLVSERARSRSLLEVLRTSEADFTADADPDVLRSERELRITLNAKSDNLTDLLAAGTDREQIERLRNEITVLEHRLEEMRVRLKRESPVYSEVTHPPPFEVEEFQRNVLDEQSILLEYFLGNDESYLWLVSKNEFEAHLLPGREAIESKVDELRRLLDARRPVANETFQQMRERVAAADAAYAPLAHQLSDMILGPVAEKLAGKRLIVVPDGKLHYFSINALPRPGATSDDPILLTNEVVYQPSAQTLSLLAKFRSTASDDRARDLLVFSDPVFSRDDARLPGVETAQGEPPDAALNLRFAESLEGLQRLPASGSEADAITEIVGSRNTDLFTGFGATRDRLLNTRLSDYKVIHLATHGIVNHERPELSAVVLSRFDESGRPMDESIRLQDIYAMKLNADLVVLSACQTASGKEIRGEGVMGLNNAFLQAGARSVVASLWQVDDNASNQLMREFYSGMADGMPVSTALRQAQIALYRDPQFRSPFFWAAYTLQGDMDRRPDIGRPFSEWWIGVLTLAFALAIALAVRLRRSRVPSKAARTT